MVMRMLVMVIGYVLTSFAVSQAGTLVLETTQQEQEIGKPFQATLYAVNLTAKLLDIDLTPLRQNFGVETDYYVEQTTEHRWPGVPIQKMRLKLYPRLTGSLTIPSLKLANIVSQSRSVTVIDGHIDQVPIDMQIHVDTYQPWQRQQFKVVFQLKSADKFPLLETQLQRSSITTDIETLSPKRDRIYSQPHQSVTQLGWLISAHAAGEQMIDLPPVKYINNGVLQRIYYLPPLKVNVRQLPPYIPPTMPVGKVIISSEISHAGMIRLNTLKYWQLQLTSDQVVSVKLPAILRQLKSNASVTFYPAESRRLDRSDTNSIHAQVIHHIPFKALQSGRVKLPQLELNYFDPDSGKIITQQLIPNAPFALATGWLIFIALSLLLLFIYLIRWSYPILLHGLRELYRLHFTRKLIKQAQSSEAIRLILANWCRMNGCSANGSLGSLVQHVPRLRQPIDELYSACYSSSATVNYVVLRDKILENFDWRVITRCHPAKRA